MIEKLSAKLMPHRFWQLALMLVLLLLMMPLFQVYQYLELLAELVFLDVLLVSLTAIGARRSLKLGLFGLWVGAIIMFFMTLTFLKPEDGHWFLVGAQILYALFLTGCTFSILAHVFHRQRVTADTIAAAVVAYLLMALVFANLYSLLNLLEPHSFIPPIGMSLDTPSHMLIEMVYFSLVTISTVGYGDMAPHLPFAQMLAGIEAVLGQLYMSVLIAWLVGLHVSQGMFSSYRNLKDHPEPLDN